MSDLSITTSQHQGKTTLTVLHLSGQLDGSTEKQLIDLARQIHQDGAQYILLDLSELSILSSAGLRAIQNIFKLVTPASDLELMQKHAEPYKSPYLKLVCPNPQIFYILNITGFMQNIFIYNNMDEAANSF